MRPGDTEVVLRSFADDDATSEVNSAIDAWSDSEASLPSEQAAAPAPHAQRSPEMRAVFEQRAEADPSLHGAEAPPMEGHDCEAAPEDDPAVASGHDDAGQQMQRSCLECTGESTSMDQAPAVPKRTRRKQKPKKAKRSTEPSARPPCMEGEKPAARQVPDFLRTLGWDQVRLWRTEWRQALHDLVRPNLRPRDAERDMQILTGAKTSDGLYEPSFGRIRVYFGTSVPYSEHEGSVFLADVSPYLDEVAQRLSVSFSVVAPRWGLGYEIGSSQMALNACQQELAYCHVAVVCGQFVPQPAVSVKDRQSRECLFEELEYALDTDIVQRTVQRQFESCIKKKNPRDVTRSLHPKSSVTKYIISACRPHTLTSLAETKGDIFFQCRRFGSSRKLETIMAKVHERLVEHSQRKGMGLDPMHPRHAQYLRDFADDACLAVMRSMKEIAEETAIVADSLVEEVGNHLQFAMSRAERFLVTESNVSCTSAVRSYLHMPATSTTSKVKHAKHIQVITGRPGSGKTFLLCKAVSDLVQNPDSSVVVARFLGTSPNSSNVHSLLDSICNQLIRIYQKDCEAPLAFAELCDFFRSALWTWPTSNRPLYLFLDGIEKLDDSNAGRRLEWLPMRASQFSRILVSCRPDREGDYRCLTHVRNEFDRLGAEEAVVFCHLTEERDASAVVEHFLHQKKRHLTLQQKERILECFKHRLEDAPGSMLWLSMAAECADRLYSIDPFAGISMSPSVRGVILELISALQQAHGRVLVSSACAYLAFARTGLAESELNHLLNLDDDVLAEVFQSHVPQVHILPSLVFVTLLRGLQSVLARRVERQSDVYTFAHLPFQEAIAGSMFCEADERQQKHEQLAGFFSGRWAGVSKPYSQSLRDVLAHAINSMPIDAGSERFVPPMPLITSGAWCDADQQPRLNTRRIHEMVHHLLQAGDVDRASDELHSVEYIAAKCAIGAHSDLQDELNLCLQMDAQCSSREVKAFLRRWGSKLRRPPCLCLTIQLAMNEPEGSVLHESATRGRSRWGECQRREGGVGAGREEEHSCRFRVHAHKGAIRALAVSPDNCRVATAGEEPQIRVWDVDNAYSLCTLHGHARPVKVLKFSPDGCTLASACEDTTKACRLWNVDSDVIESNVLKAQGCVTCLAFSATSIAGRRLLATGCEKLVMVWDVESRQLLANVSCASESAGVITSLAFSPDVQCLVFSGSDNVISMWRTALPATSTAAAWSKSSKFGVHRGAGTVSSLVFSRDGKKIVGASADGVLQTWAPGCDSSASTWSAATHCTRADLQTWDVHAMLLRREGCLLASAGWDGGHGHLALWEVDSKQPIRFVPIGPGLRIRCMAFGAPQERVGVGGGGRERETLLGGDARRDPLIVTGSSDGQLYVWDLDEGHARGHQNEPGGQGSK